MGSIWQATIIDSTGKPTAGATVTVRNESDSSLSAIFSDIDCVIPKDNPFFSDSNGYAYFYTEGALLKITATKGGHTATWRNVAFGFATEAEVTALGVDVELNKEIWKDQDGVEHRLWISEEEPDDEYDGEDGDIWFVREAVES